MKLPSFHFHSWFKIKEPERRSFLGKDYTDYSIRFKVCRKCGCAKEFLWDSGGGCWRSLNREQTKILFDEFKDLLSELGIKREEQ